MQKVVLPMVAIAITGAFTCEGAAANPAISYASEKIVYAFTGGADGGWPYDQLSFSGANIVGTTYEFGAHGQGTVYSLTTKGQLTTLHAWIGGDKDGEYVTQGVIADAEGNLYGTTGYGGTSDDGIVYKLDTAGVLTVLHSFSGCTDGGLPMFGNLVLSEGVLYGVTASGYEQSCPTVHGTAFQIGTDGSNYKVTYTFTNGTPERGYDAVGQVALLNGSVYGTTEDGGVGDGVGGGTVFQINAAGKESALLRFRGESQPSAGVMRGKDGKLYGTTAIGSKYQKGTVFVVDTSGTQTVLHAFTGKHGDGAYPTSALVQDAGGNFYGTTQGGGTKEGNGTVFEITAAGTFITIYKFKGGTSDGQYPFAGMAIGPDGDLYGTTEFGGPSNDGVVFRVTPNQ
jgi:uncharacterized repeat protein (TIGR03803 family)